MADVLVRNVADALKERLKESARKNGRSLEAEIRERLLDSFGGPDPDFWRGIADRAREHGFTQEDLDRMEEIKREPIPERISFE